MSDALFVSYGADMCYARVKSQLRAGEIIIAGDQWPIFLYAGYKFDPEEPWKGLLRSAILISVSALTAAIQLI